MKKKMLIVILVALLSQVAVQAQSAKPLKDQYDFYMHKRKKQKITGWVMVGSGLIMTASGMAINVSNMDFYISLTGNTSTHSAKNNKGLWLCYTGGAITLIGITCLICAGLNKKRARLVIKEEKAIVWPKAPTIHYTALSLKIVL